MKRYLCRPGRQIASPRTLRASAATQAPAGDRWGESITGYNVAMVWQSLNGLDDADIQLLEVVALDEAIGRPDLESDRAALEEVRVARRAQATDSWPAP